MSGNDYITIGIAIIIVSTVLFVSVIGVLAFLYKRSKSRDQSPETSI